MVMPIQKNERSKSVSVNSHNTLVKKVCIVSKIKS